MNKYQEQINTLNDLIREYRRKIETREGDKDIYFSGLNSKEKDSIVNTPDITYIDACNAEIKYYTKVIENLSLVTNLLDAFDLTPNTKNLDRVYDECLKEIGNGDEIDTVTAIDCMVKLYNAKINSIENLSMIPVHKKTFKNYK